MVVKLMSFIFYCSSSVVVSLFSKVGVKLLLVYFLRW